jgi:hypothetical protein
MIAIFLFVTNPPTMCISSARGTLPNPVYSTFSFFIDFEIFT